MPSASLNRAGSVNESVVRSSSRHLCQDWPNNRPTLCGAFDPKPPGAPRGRKQRERWFRKSGNDPNLHRYIMVDREPHWPTSRASGKGN